MNIQHSSRSDEWYTPDAVLEVARKVLGTIDLDPASSLEANKRVGATQIITKEQGGLSTPWNGRTLFINPPGGKLGNRSKTTLFWKRLMDHRAGGALDHAIFLAFSLEALQTTQDKDCLPMARFPLCIPAFRLRFLEADGTEGKAPSHSNCIVYVPGYIDRTAEFEQAFGALGSVLNTRRHP